MTPHEERLRLLALARQAIAASLGGERLVVDGASRVGRRAGVFVTLRLSGALRGCIGHLDPQTPVDATVARCAVAAANADPRFPPLTAVEFDAVAIEVSVLSAPEVVEDLGEIVIGQHGLIVSTRKRRGLLLPQVATEWGWDAAAFVAQTCTKAGLPPDAWPGRGVTLERFEADVFAED